MTEKEVHGCSSRNMAIEYTPSVSFFGTILMCKNDTFVFTVYNTHNKPE